MTVDNDEEIFLFNPENDENSIFSEITSQLEFEKKKAETSLRLAEEESEEMCRKYNEDIQNLKDENLQLKNEIKKRDNELKRFRLTQHKEYKENEICYLSPRVLVSTGVQTDSSDEIFTIDTDAHKELLHKMTLYENILSEKEAAIMQLKDTIDELNDTPRQRTVFTPVTHKRHPSRNKAHSEEHFSIQTENIFLLLKEDEMSGDGFNIHSPEDFPNLGNTVEKHRVTRSNSYQISPVTVDHGNKTKRSANQLNEKVHYEDNFEPNYSHRKNLNNLVQQRTHVNVCSYVRPGARFNSVVEEVKEISKNLTRRDHLLVIAGTNNIETTGVARFLDDVNNLIKNTENINLLLATIPMRHDVPHLDLKISRINSELENLAEKYKNSLKLLPLHLLPRHLFTLHGLHMNKKGKNKVAKMIVEMINPALQTVSMVAETTLDKTRGHSTVMKTGKINVINADMGDIIEHLKNNSSTAFAHSISAVFEDPRHMTAGVAVVFRKKFGRPKTTDYVNNSLTCQIWINGATIYSLVTKPRYFGKPTTDSYDESFEQLKEDFKNKGLKTLICSPIGCVRDLIDLEHFAKNIVEFHLCTGATIGIISTDQKSTRELRKGLSHVVFLEKLQEKILVAQNVQRQCQSQHLSKDLTEGNHQHSQNGTKDETEKQTVAKSSDRTPSEMLPILSTGTNNSETQVQPISQCREILLWSVVCHVIQGNHS
ncbi:purine nucleoside metabolic process [Homalodisca vitripennis]|nr:purine nucleoside metabolic process [Homalodisca vitripennis]